MPVQLLTGWVTLGSLPQCRQTWTFEKQEFIIT